ncbi:glycosyl transferase [Advenella faeciporci]|uniref:Glycosyl transferase n=1 Tax=Advenella faeciporci TaxID=797535 RepID=A0A918N194_9BURK|nr:glycosyltransferase family 4 protein [Advenella faeciporci]GGW93344.1 glycosyl transferase [Advenella faeciporci]
MSFLLIASYPDSLIKFRGPLIDALSQKGLQVHVAVPNIANNNILKNELESKGIIVHDIPLRRTGMNPLADMITLVHLLKLILRIKPEYVLGYTIKPVIYGSMASWLAKVPNRFALITGLGYAFQGQQDSTSTKRGLTRQLVQRLYSLALGRTHKVFFQNPDDLALFKKLKILKPSTPTFVVNGSGVNISEYEVVPLPLQPRFLLIARLLGDKGVREYAQAAKRIKSTHPEVNFDLVGWIDENPDAIKQQDLDTWIGEGTLNYLGKLADVRPALSNCSVYVLPSYREGTPRTVLEAMSMGRTIITTDAPGCRETVIDNDNGFLVPVKSVEALVVAMKNLIDNPDLIKKMGQRSREIAEEKYDVHKVNDSMLKAMGISESTNRYA